MIMGFYFLARKTSLNMFAVATCATSTPQKLFFFTHTPVARTSTTFGLLLVSCKPNQSNSICGRLFCFLLHCQDNSTSSLASLRLTRCFGRLLNGVNSPSTYTTTYSAVAAAAGTAAAAPPTTAGYLTRQATGQRLQRVPGVYTK